MARERSYRHDIRSTLRLQLDAQRWTRTRASSAQARRLQSEVHGVRNAAALPGASQAALRLRGSCRSITTSATRARAGVAMGLANDQAYETITELLFPEENAK